MAAAALSPLPSGGFLRGRRWSTRPGRASSSTSWIEDKLRAGAAPTYGGGGGESKIAGRASLSESWVQDKLSWQRAPESPNAGGGRRKRSPCRTPSADNRCDKKARSADNEDDEEDNEEKFSGPTFSVTPEPKDLPIPTLLLLPHFI
ncbi:hypothetical protein E2562_020556 [Oryza meyeriana var. granulata]|uniref:Uncharacterized protein n=1 Tax=Oryza meyeriana var. granulata TaxID=110450 RepID=A0A6G1EAX9_9ORYZ|nr:hypothetical protein E2562_020556 [Oryza meyeriana var. granulata]